MTTPEAAPYDPGRPRRCRRGGLPDGFALNFSTFTNGTPKNAPQIAQAVSQHLAEVGITAEVQEIEFQSEQNRSNNRPSRRCTSGIGARASLTAVTNSGE
jgi:ABC-type transport system substrate-binding protein